MLLDVPRNYVVLSQQLGATSKAKTLAIANTLLEAKRILAKHVKGRRGIIHANGRAGRVEENGSTEKVLIKRRRVDALDSNRPDRRGSKPAVRRRLTKGRR